jgi:4-diphosphocytidyl-2-C-methyl-D-erythritol kinase
MVVFPNCKINIGLNIINRRTDGFHDIESVFYPVPWNDILEIIPSEREEFIFEGTKIDCTLNDNLCYKAYQLIKDDYKIPSIKLYLYKNIPSGAGLGGGSSDAAFTLQTLNSLFSLGLSDEKLLQYASVLGSDCAFFIKNKPIYATGKGNVFEDIPVNLKGYYLLIVKPKLNVSTAEAYKLINQETPETSLIDSINLPVSKWKLRIKNDFETPLFHVYPELKVIKDKLYALGAVYSSMSGSGSAIYGLYESMIDFRKEFPDMSCWMKQL